MSTRAAVSCVALAVATLMAAAGCSPGGAEDKAGADTIVLKLATIDGQVNTNGYGYAAEPFVEALPRVSGGRIRVEVETTYGGGSAASESELVQAIAEGEVDGGWPSVRAFAGAGIPGLAALEAPLIITSYPAEKAIARGDAADIVRRTLDGAGIEVLGLAVGPLRRPFGVKSFLLSVGDWQEMRFRSYNSPTQNRTIEALGGKAVQAGVDWPDLAQGGELDGIEFDVAQYLANGYRLQAGKVVSNVVLWPKMAVLSLNQKLWDGLSTRQREWIRRAADRAVQASIAGHYPDDDIAEELCGRGVRFRSASPDDLLALHRAVQPVIDQLANDPKEAPLLREVQAAADRYPGPDTITVPASCTTEATLPHDSDIPSTYAPIPAGIYRKEISEDDVAAAGLANNDGTSGIWTLEVAHGHWYVSCRPLSSPGVDCGQSVADGYLDAGSFYGDKHAVWMVSEPEVLAEATGCKLPANDSGSEGHCYGPPPGAGPPPRLEWTLDGDDLVFRSNGLSGAFETVLKPYVRID